MKGFLAILAFAGTAMGHSQFTSLHINGVPNTSCVRPAVSADPLTILDSPDMACNIVSGNGKTKCTVKRNPLPPPSLLLNHTTNLLSRRRNCIRMAR